MKFTIAGLAFTFVLSTYVQAADEFPGIRQLMTKEEFIKAGLDRQTKNEMEALNAWLIRYTANDAALMSQKKPVKREKRKEISSRITGEFKGWTGKTLFILENGHVWKQRLNGKWRTQMTNPEITIKRNLLGFYELKVVGTHASIGVKRIK